MGCSRRRPQSPGRGSTNMTKIGSNRSWWEYSHMGLTGWYFVGTGLSPFLCCPSLSFPHPLVLAALHRRQHLYAYRCLPHLEGGANLTITCLWRTICSMIEEGCFPRDKTLYLQIDGGSENVNRVMPQFACWLCQNKICNTVRLSVCLSIDGWLLKIGMNGR